MEMTITMRSYTEQAADLRRESARQYRHHRKDARDAARFYQVAAQERRAVAELNARPQRWGWCSPAEREANALVYVRLADTYLRSSLDSYQRAVEYRELAKQYEAWAAEQDVRLAEIAADQAAAEAEKYQVVRLDEELLITGYGWREAASISNELLLGTYAIAGRFQEAEERRSYRPVYPAAPEPDHARALEQDRHDKLVELLGGGGCCAYCRAEVYVAEDAKVLAVSEPADSEEADFCPADSGTHHSQPVDCDRLADEIAELACLYAAGSCARLGEFEAAVQIYLDAM